MLHIDAPAGTIRLGSGPSVALGGQTNLKLTNAAGEYIYVNVAGLNGNFVGDLDVDSSAFLSIDDGATKVAVTDFSADATVTNAATGRVFYVDPSQLVRTGTEPVRVPGTYNVFDTMIYIRDLLKNDRGLTVGEQSELLTTAHDSLDEVMSGIRQQLTAVGARLNAMDNLRNSLEDISVVAQTEAASLQNADIIQLTVDLARTQNLYAMTLASSARLLSLSLLDFI